MLQKLVGYAVVKAVFENDSFLPSHYEELARANTRLQVVQIAKALRLTNEDVITVPRFEWIHPVLIEYKVTVPNAVHAITCDKYDAMNIYAIAKRHHFKVHIKQV